VQATYRILSEQFKIMRY